MMEYFYVLTSNRIINITLMAWFIAQLCKVVLVILTQKRIDFSRFIGSGGMPSSHAATVSALTAAVALQCGFSSAEFAISFAFSLVVMYDAAGVRRAAGKQAEILNKILEGWDSDDPEILDVRLKELLGHTPVQVFVGAFLGILVAVLMK